MKAIPQKQVLEIDQDKCGLVIRKLRKKFKVSLRALAKHMGISAPYLSDLERGNRDWTELRFIEATKGIEDLTK